MRRGEGGHSKKTTVSRFKIKVFQLGGWKEDIHLPKNNCFKIQVSGEGPWFIHFRQLRKSDCTDCRNWFKMVVQVSSFKLESPRLYPSQMHPHRRRGERVWDEPASQGEEGEIANPNVSNKRDCKLQTKN